MKRLKSILKKFKKVLLAYSGGVDSTFLLKVAIDTLGKENVLAIIAKSETYPKSEEKKAIDIAKNLSANCRVIKTCEFSDKNFIKNPRDRCYYCKKELFSKLSKLAKKEKIKYIIDGSNKDDLSDYRPGTIAKKEFGIRSPLQESGFTKEAVRELSRKLSLKTWNKPALACLASRIPYGTKITKEKLNRINKSEEFLKSLGFGQLRVRDHGDLARIEVDKKEFSKILNKKITEKITKKLKNLGYNYITIDIQGYRTGAMNETLH
ncbi:TIGR00268 family protein [candidate division WOR-1 bacterium RIFOXYC2_FULL_37_10]|uniref:TIGR00268 family protein n=1 Tax=candidate division WOR-1 bacterium RIFOXYB2_FULL_37_13 TaxID=1802579 RepID=A0A1F4SHF4_UNCSA|nr:MAG: TIGR00268 family protein [candidate division WOR-1 bacterium RIFOXYA2_FULL_37_7]OGC19860.1 MAG: TIGR00268 family protein [candidate division WOR-1 bacterium RIFOXYB2_FULL_37_13]OGC32954.1 MAG: TIGR00268 family protein [candidate division WOR-1 bacterium RIFOXYC2_FULL_37_10]